MSFNDGQKRGYICQYKDGKVVTNLTYTEALIRFSDAHETDNPCTVYPPGYGHRGGSL